MTFVHFVYGTNQLISFQDFYHFLVYFKADTALVISTQNYNNSYNNNYNYNRSSLKVIKK